MTRLVVGLLLVAVAPGNVRADEKTDLLQAQLDAAKKELEALRKKNAELEEKLTAAVLELEKVKREALRAENEAKLATAIADDNAKKIEELINRINALKQAGGLPQAPPPRLKGARQPAPLPEGVRGTVTDVAFELLMIDIGVDVGLEVGTVLDVYRVDGNEKRYLGTVKVTSALNLFPKQAIVTFTPARNVPLDKLRPEEFPKKGDQVRPQETKP